MGDHRSRMAADLVGDALDRSCKFGAAELASWDGSQRDSVAFSKPNVSQDGRCGARRSPNGELSFP